MTEKKRIGRPPGGDSEETRRRLLDAGKLIFSKQGYSSASNKLISEKAQVSRGAIYYYFPTKQALFLAIHQELQELQLNPKEDIVENATSFSQALLTILEDIIEFRIAHPHSSAFFAVVRTEARRNSEIADALEDGRWLALYDNLIKLGIKTGEISESQSHMVKAVLSVCLLGLTHHSAEATLTAHKNAVKGLGRLVKGELLSSKPESG
mgnify:CR=1 FL=1